MGSAPAALGVDGISKRFGSVVALDHVTFELPSGGCLALVGESGSGKSTLLRCLNRLVEPDAGRVTLDEADVAAIDPVLLRRRIGYVPQDGGLLPHWRVLRNVALVCRLNGDSGADRKASDALSLVGLDPSIFATRWPRELSGGQRQRVAIARALAAEPGILLLDEPFGALDAITRGELQEAFVALRERLGTTAVLVTHDIQEALLLATHVAVMRRGRVEQLDAPRALVAAPASEYVRTLLRRARIGELEASL